MTEQQDRKMPVETFKDGMVSVKLWEQRAGEQTFLTASIGKSYQDKQTGEWRESKSFSSKDLLKLQALLPEAQRRMQRRHDQHRAMNPEQAQEPEQSTTQPTTQTHGLSAQRNAVMQEAERNENASPEPQSPAHNPDRDHSR